MSRTKLLSMMRKKGIPSRYQEVEYIESTGTQWIDTGIVRYIDHTYRYVGEVSFSDITNRQVMGVQGNAYFGVVNGKYQIGNPVTDTVDINAVLNTFVPFDVTYDIPNRKIYYSIAENLNLSRSQSMSNNPPLAHFYLFSLNNGVLPCSWKLKTTQIYDNGTLVRNYIPVYDTETQKYGMWESVERKFYGNDGTGDFKGSIVGYTIVGSPTIVDGVVSGFSSSDYLEISNSIVDLRDDFKQNSEFVTKIVYPSSGAGKTIIYFPYTGATTCGINRWYANKINLLFLDSVAIETQSGFNANDNVWVKVKIKNGIAELLTSVDSVNWVSAGSLDITEVAQSTYDIKIKFGVNSGGEPFLGSIDLNSTYIKINNKLWFNGQQA